MDHGRVRNYGGTSSGGTGKTPVVNKGPKRVGVGTRRTWWKQGLTFHSQVVYKDAVDYLVVLRTPFLL